MFYFVIIFNTFPNDAHHILASEDHNYNWANSFTKWSTVIFILFTLVIILFCLTQRLMKCVSESLGNISSEYPDQSTGTRAFQLKETVMVPGPNDPLTFYHQQLCPHWGGFSITIPLENFAYFSGMYPDCPIFLLNIWF